MTTDELNSADYPPEWKDGTIQRRIRQIADYTCEICGRKFDPATNMAVEPDESGQPVYGHVHHLDNHPPNCSAENLIFLCQRCHIQLHGWGWKPGEAMPISWGNEPPQWVIQRKLTYKLNPMVASWHEAARYAARREDRIRFIIDLIENQNWIMADVDPVAAMQGFLSAVLAEYRRVHDQRTQTEQMPVLAQAEAWAAEHGYVTFAEAVERSALGEQDFGLAQQHGFITPEICPYQGDFIPAYFDPVKVRLDEKTLHALWSQSQITRTQAAAMLGIPVAVFERRRREAGIKHISIVQTQSDRHDHVYRRIDIEKLRR